MCTDSRKVDLGAGESRNFLKRQVFGPPGLCKPTLRFVQNSAHLAPPNIKANHLHPPPPEYFILSSHLSYPLLTHTEYSPTNPTPNQQQMLGLLAVAKIALVVGGTVAVAPALAIGGLGLLGFSAAGPVAGTVAAGVQSAVYGGAVGSGSLFAIAQGAAMGGIAVSAVQTVGGALGYVAAVLI